MVERRESTENSPAAPEPDSRSARSERAVCLKEKNPSLQKSVSDDGAVGGIGADVRAAL